MLLRIVIYLFYFFLIFSPIRYLHKYYFYFQGDFLETTCLYRTLDKVNATIGGHAITDEMCVNYLHYYPATELEVCKSAVANEALENYFKFEKRLVKKPTNFRLVKL